jgi:hypothetical protein
MPYYYPILPAVIIIIVSMHYAVNAKRALLPAAGLAVAFGLLGYSFYIIKTTPFGCGNPESLDESRLAQKECVLRELAMPEIRK